VTSLVFALIFVGVVGMWALIASDTMDLPDLLVLGPALLVVAGFIGLAATLGTSSKERARVAAASRAGAEQQAAVQHTGRESEQYTEQHTEPEPDVEPATLVEPATDPEAGQGSTS